MGRKRKKRDSFVFYRSWLDVLEDWDGEAVKKLLFIAADYGIDAKTPQPEQLQDGRISDAFKFMKHRLNEDRTRYINACEEKSAAKKDEWKRKKGAQECTDVHKGAQGCTRCTDSESVSASDNASVSDSENEKNDTGRKFFIRPADN